MPARYQTNPFEIFCSNTYLVATPVSYHHYFHIFPKDIPFLFSSPWKSLRQQTDGDQGPWWWFPTIHLFITTKKWLVYIGVMESTSVIPLHRCYPLSIFCVYVKVSHTPTEAKMQLLRTFADSINCTAALRLATSQSNMNMDLHFFILNVSYCTWGYIAMKKRFEPHCQVHNANVATAAFHYLVISL